MRRLYYILSASLVVGSLFTHKETALLLLLGAIICYQAGELKEKKEIMLAPEDRIRLERRKQEIIDEIHFYQDYSHHAQENNLEFLN